VSKIKTNVDSPTRTHTLKFDTVSESAIRGDNKRLRIGHDLSEKNAGRRINQRIATAVKHGTGSISPENG
jgi:hypothetical protein